MAGVFLSYDREDLPRARSLALALEKAGHSVWWDRHIKGGAQYSKEIEQQLARADAVIVLWSQRSIDSAWVRDEAAAARDTNRLVPVRLDETEPPLGFRQYHTIDLSQWSGRGKPSQLRETFEAINALAGQKPAIGPPDTGRQFEAGQRQRRRPPPWLLIGMSIVLLAMLIGLLVARPWEAKRPVPVVVVKAADATTDARTLARDLLVELGNVQSSKADAVQLVEDGAGGAPDLVIEVTGRLSGPAASANLVLLRGKDQKLLSSQEFAASGATANDLRDSLAMSAARLLGCATEAMAPTGGLPQDMQRLYIDACARFGMLYGSEDIAILLPQFQQVLDRRPGFVPAWKLLLLSKAFLLVTPTDQAKPSAATVRAQITKARRVEATMPEIGIAELQLLPITDFDGRMRLMERLADQFPDNPFVLDVLAEELMLVGRMNEAVANAERAVMIDRTAPFARSAHIKALAYSGRIPRAFQELDRAAPLALGAKTLIEPRFRLNMRYGDPQVALQLLRTHGTSKQHEAFLLARIDPAPANIERAIAISRATAKEMGFLGSHLEVLAEFGREEEIYSTVMSLPTESINQGVILSLFRPTLKALRQDPRFLKIAARLDLLDYWRKSGNWPDFCSEPGLPYDCKAEAAKLG